MAPGGVVGEDWTQQSCGAAAIFNAGRGQQWCFDGFADPLAMQSPKGMQGSHDARMARAAARTQCGFTPTTMGGGDHGRRRPVNIGIVKRCVAAP